MLPFSGKTLVISLIVTSIWKIGEKNICLIEGRDLFFIWMWNICLLMCHVGYLLVRNCVSIINIIFSSVQFSSVAQLCPTLCDSMNHSTPGLPVHHQFPEFTQTHVHRVNDAIQPSHPLSSPSPPAPNAPQHQGLSFYYSLIQVCYLMGQAGCLSSRYHISILASQRVEGM